ncbi:peptidoglycan-binding domain-containing protein [Streptomyces xanthophaeus]|uniref:peptidoglycan-binding domain-containing protein n=1 Tax=Streptomyces xanthophaeus TaxID=67385 RepID=UPI00264769CF|nr:peptidoglycan-binding domain-containing protein [Streptomyces xanthophaeus]WKD33217.1 peptidoglycan-binding protein [Streptomyces xanthophaeus]
MSEAEQVVEHTEAPAAAADDDRGGLARGRRVVLAVVGGAALMAVGGLLATTLVKSPAQVAAETGPPAQGVLTADVERRVLAQTVVMRGTVVADQSVAVSPQGVRSGEGTGAALVTKLPLKAGDPVTAGQLIAEVSGRPVFTLHGAQPMYRDLRPGATGDDVAQLQQALRELGHGTGGDAKGVFGAGTKAALAARYRAIGYEPLPAVADGGAALKSAREAVRSATWAVEDASGPTGPVGAPAEGGSGKGGATPGPGATASPGPGSGSGSGRELARARQALGEARAALAAAEAADGPMLPTAEAVFLGSFPARVSSVGARAGSPVAGPVLTLSGGELVVEAYLKDDKRQLLRAGMTVVISSELSGTDVRGKVAVVATERSAAQPAGPQPQQDPGQNPKGGGGGGPVGAGADLGHRMVVTADQPLPAGFAGQDVRLTIESAATDGEALVVPVTAVSAGADGRTVVTAVSADGTQRRIEVRAGTSGDGFVAVTPARAGALAAGTKVVIGVAPRETRGKTK